jgi:heme-degrading monooxygenase HmoA
MPVAIAIHHPRPQHCDEWLEIMRQAGQASASLPGLIGTITGYREADGARLVGVSHWESIDALEAGIAGIKQQSQQADDAWGKQPTEVLVLSEL